MATGRPLIGSDFLTKIERDVGNGAKKNLEGTGWSSAQWRLCKNAEAIGGEKFKKNNFFFFISFNLAL